MLKKILLLTDYKGFFGSKQKNHIYRGGMNLHLIRDLFRENGYEMKVAGISQVKFSEIVQERPLVLYTSSEDKNNFYKSYIEDIIFHLEESGITVMPPYEYLKAHNNKVAMELLRTRSNFKPIQTIHSEVFGSLDELLAKTGDFTYPVVIKPASGAMSKGVTKADNCEELILHAKKISGSPDMAHDSKELLRLLKYKKNYVRESFFRNKFIVQNLIPNLTNDWKVLVFDDRSYILYRGNRDGDFRASGSGKFEFRKEIPEGILDFALEVKKHFKVPHISLDVGFDGEKFHLIEFQFLYFGTTTLEKSPFYFLHKDGKWERIEEKSDLESVYVKSIVAFLQNENPPL